MRIGNDFRGKDIDTDNWVYGSLMTNGADETYIYVPSGFGGFEKHKVNGYSVGECIGIVDKNRTRVFEGDIVCHYKNCNIVYGVIERKYCNWIIQYNNYYEPIISDTLDYAFEVMGNRWDNPELLNKIIRNETAIEEENKVLKELIEALELSDSKNQAIINNFKLNVHYAKHMKDIFGD